jgi:hypothetical protein
MEAIGLVKVVKQGRKKRHHLAQLGQALIAGSLNMITETFVLFLMEKLEDGCLNPEVREKTTDRITIRIDCPERGKDCFITINLKEWRFQTFEDEESNTSIKAEKAQIESA